jgi:hypothetical protein
MGIPAARGVGAAGMPNAGDQANAVLSGTITAVGPTAPFAFRGPMNLVIYASYNTSLITTSGSLSASVISSGTLAAGDSINSTLVPHGSTIGTMSGASLTLKLMPHTDYGVFGSALGSGGLLTGEFDTARIVGGGITIPSNAEGVVLPAGTTVTEVVQAFVAPTDTSPGTPGIVQLSNLPTSLPTDPNPRPFYEIFTSAAIVSGGTDSTAVFTGAAITYSGTVQLERSFDGGTTWIVCNIGGSGQLAQWSAGTPVSLTFGEPEKNVLYRLNCTAYSAGTINYRISQTGGAAESLAIGPLTNG